MSMKEKCLQYGDINKDLVRLYLESKSGFAPTTLKNKGYALEKALKLSADLDPDKLMSGVLELKPYSRKIFMMNVSAFTKWLALYDTSFQPVQDRMLKWFALNSGSGVWRNAYKKKKVGLTWEEYQEELGNHERGSELWTLLIFYGAGARRTEPATYNSGDNTVVGKGSKKRELILIKEEDRKELRSMDKKRILYLCRKLEHTPHEYRHMAVTKALTTGLANDPYRYASIFGWSDVKTAQSYQQETAFNSEQYNIRRTYYAGD